MTKLNLNVEQLNTVIYELLQYVCLKEATDDLTNAGLEDSRLSECDSQVEGIYKDAKLVGDDKLKAVVNFVAQTFQHCCVCDECIDENTGEVGWYAQAKLSKESRYDLLRKYLLKLLILLTLHDDDMKQEIALLWLIINMYVEISRHAESMEYMFRIAR